MPGAHMREAELLQKPTDMPFVIGEPKRASITRFRSIRRQRTEQARSEFLHPAWLH